MKPYTIPYIEESYKKVTVYADSLQEAVKLFTDQGPEVGILESSEVMDDSFMMDRASIYPLNKTNHPQEAEGFK